MSTGSKSSRRRWLFIQPIRPPTNEPLIDELTMRMTSALRRASWPRYTFCGVHVCMCGAVSAPKDGVLGNGAVTNTLCVHYLAYHRAEVPIAELDAVPELPASAEVPSPEELCVPECRRRREHVNW